MGLNELRTKMVCYSARAAFSGNKLWEEKYPEAAKALWAFAQTYAQPDPSQTGNRNRYRRITAVKAIDALRVQGFAKSSLPTITTMTAILNRNGLRQVRNRAEAQESARVASYNPSANRHTETASLD